MYNAKIREGQRHYDKVRKILDWPKHNFLTSKRTYALVKYAGMFIKNFKNVKVIFRYDSFQKEFEAAIKIYIPNVKDRVASYSVRERKSYIFLMTTYKPFIVEENIGGYIIDSNRTQKGIDYSIKTICEWIKNANLKPEEVFTDECIKSWS